MSILSPSDAQNLIAIGLASPESPEGTVIIHRRCLNCSSNEEYSHLSLSPISTQSARLSNELYTTIPATMISLATIKFLGYTDLAANRIWNRWNNWPSSPPGRYEVDPDGEILFVDVATSYLTRFRNHDTSDDDDQAWYNFMDLCGIRPEVQANIMDSTYKRIRLTESCYFWIKETIELGYRSLEAIQAASKERAEALERGHGSGERGGSFTGPSDTAPTFGGGSGQRSISGTLRSAPGISPNTAFSCNTRLNAQNLPGYITLYKGLDQARLDGFFDDSGNIKRWATVVSRPPSDFTRRIAYYFAVDRDIAEHYAYYAKRRVNVSSVVIMHVNIPIRQIKGLSSVEFQETYWPSMEWKNLVWHGRTKRRLRGEAAKFERACLIIGTVAKKSSGEYEKMDSPEEIDESCVLKNKTGRNAVQYVFNDDEGEELLQALPRNSWSVHLVTAEEFRNWEE